MERKEQLEHQRPEEIIVVKAKTPQELSLRKANTTVVFGCDGDGCNDDTGGCDAADAGCGQDC